VAELQGVLLRACFQQQIVKMRQRPRFGATFGGKAGIVIYFFKKGSTQIQIELLVPQRVLLVQAWHQATILALAN
jgi:hypothetical protein